MISSVGNNVQIPRTPVANGPAAPPQTTEMAPADIHIASPLPSAAPGR